MKTGDRIKLHDGDATYFYTVVEVDEAEAMVRVVDDNGAEEVFPMWAMEYMWDVELI